MSEPVQGWVQTVPTLSETQPYEKIVRLTVPWLKGGGKLPPPFLNSLAVDSTRDELSRLDHFEHMLEMVLAEPVNALSYRSQP